MSRTHPIFPALTPEILPHPQASPTTSMPSCWWRIMSCRGGRRGSAEAQTAASPSCLDRKFRVRRPRDQPEGKRNLAECLSSPFLPLTNGVRSRRGTFSFRLPPGGRRVEWRRPERHFSACFLFVVVGGGDICLDGAVQSSRSRGKKILRCDTRRTRILRISLLLATAL